MFGSVEVTTLADSGTSALVTTDSSPKSGTTGHIRHCDLRNIQQAVVVVTKPPMEPSELNVSFVISVDW